MIEDVCAQLFIISDKRLCFQKSYSYTAKLKASGRGDDHPVWGGADVTQISQVSEKFHSQALTAVLTSILP